MSDLNNSFIPPGGEPDEDLTPTPPLSYYNEQEGEEEEIPTLRSMSLPHQRATSTMHLAPTPAREPAGLPLLFAVNWRVRVESSAPSRPTSGRLRFLSKTTLMRFARHSSGSKEESYSALTSLLATLILGLEHTPRSFQRGAETVCYISQRYETKEEKAD